MRSAALLLLVAFAGHACAQSRYAVAWERVVSSTNFDQINQVALGADGSVYVAGAATAALEEGDNSFGSIFLRKYDGAGTPQWTKKVPRQVTTDWGTGVTVAADGSVLFAASLLGDTFLARYDEAGVELSSVIDVNVDYTHSAKLTPAPTGGAYLYGSTTGGAPGGTGHFVKRLADPSGELPISLGATLQEAAPDFTEDVAGVVGDADGNTYVLGMTDYGVYLGPVDAYLRKYDPLGGMEWTSYFPLPASGTVSGLAIGPDGAPVAVGHGIDSSDPTGQAGWNAYAWKFSNEGDVEWNREWGGTSGDFARSVTVTESGDILIAGEADGDLGGPQSVTGRQAVVTAFSAAGEPLWAEKLFLPAYSGALSIVADSGGDIFLGGYRGSAQGAQGREGLLVRLTPTEPLAGDYSRDGVVDAIDYNLWRDRYGQQRSLSVTDGNDDGVVDAADYTIWRDNLTAPSSLEVPEPVALSLAVLAMIRLACSRRSDAR